MSPWRIFAAAVTLATALGIVGSIWWYFYAGQELQKRWYVDDQTWSAAILKDLAELNRQQNQQNEEMRYIRNSLHNLQNDHVNALRDMGVLKEKLEFHRGRHEVPNK